VPQGAVVVRVESTLPEENEFMYHSAVQV